MSLRAKLPILYKSKQYRVGDTLPATDDRMIAAWIKSGAAFWDEVDVHEKEHKAQAVTAEAALPGKSSDGDPEALVGKVPKRAPRKRATK